MAILQFELGPLDNNTYLIVDEPSREAALVDPSFDSEGLWPQIQAQGYIIRYVLNTHAHFDHVVGNAFFVHETGAPLALHRADLDLLRSASAHATLFQLVVPPSPEPTFYLEDGQTLSLGESILRVSHCPGHSPGGVTLLVGDDAIVGDCLFAGSIGRTDLPGASQATLLHTIRTRLLTLPDHTRVLPGHGALTTIGAERRTNPYLQG